MCEVHSLYIFLEPNIINENCSQYRLKREIDIASPNGSCTSDKCAVETTIMLYYDEYVEEDWNSNFVGSIFFTCTEHSWFPPKPKHETCRKGKSDITSDFNFIIFMICVEHSM